MEQSIGKVSKLRIATLINNAPKYDTYLKGCFGISFWIEVTSGATCKNILLDVGPVAEPLFYNAEKMGIDLSLTDMIVLSHCHFDHTAALADVVSAIGHEVPIVAHPALFRSCFALKPEFTNYGMVGKNRRGSIESLGGYFILSRAPLELYPGFMFTGEVERTTPFEETGGASSFTTDSDGNVVADPILDDASVVINVQDRGIVVVTGCAHAGPVNTLKHSVRHSGVSKVEGIMGGFHLLEAGQDRVDLTIEEFRKYNPGWIAPMHCTGLVPSAKIAMAFPGRYRDIAAGDVVEYT